MSAETILNKIEAEATAEAESITAAAETQAKQLRDTILSEADKQVKKLQADTAEKAKELARRQTLLAGLAVRKNALAARRAVLDEAFDAAKAALLALPKARYEALLTKLIIESADTGCEQLLVPATDRPCYTEGLLDRLNAALTAAGKQGRLSLAEEDAPFEGGVMLIGEKTDVNASFDALLKAAREQYERQVTDLLFGPEVS